MEPSEGIRVSRRSAYSNGHAAYTSVDPALLICLDIQTKVRLSVPRYARWTFRTSAFMSANTTAVVFNTVIIEVSGPALFPPTLLGRQDGDGATSGESRSQTVSLNIVPLKNFSRRRRDLCKSRLIFKD
ncbi:hypothetical protein TNCV_447911 [Trichonephila clavipes]|nr:hypothetical protein TNCV_447911 [Trichonephila clavipes]